MDRGTPLSPAALAVNWHAAFSAGEIDVALRQHARDVELIDLGREQLLVAPGALALWLTAWKVAFPDAQFEDVQVEVLEGAVSTAATLAGTHQGPLGGLAPTGRAVRLSVTDVLHLDAQGWVTRHYVHYDPKRLFDQLGEAVPRAFAPMGLPASRS